MSRKNELGVHKRYLSQIPEAQVSEEYFSLIKKPEFDDPVFRQVAPSMEEMSDQGADDPVGEAAFSPVPGLIHRFRDRALLIPTSRCFVRCRHCMRKRLWGKGEEADDYRVRQWRLYLGSRPEINEVIVSGGDPLTLSDRRLGEILGSIAGVRHVREVRVHTRAVAAAPSRITPELAALLARRKVRRLVTQFNHAQEVSAGAARAVKVLSAAGIEVLNQSVLLRGVNDRAKTLAGLFAASAGINVSPYYLHHPDPVRGAMHFTLSLKEGWAVYSKARRESDPSVVPAYVVDLPGRRAKVEVERVLARG
jgi:lysine 2,3-aminomutase